MEADGPGDPHPGRLAQRASEDASSGGVLSGRRTKARTVIESVFVWRRWVLTISPCARNSPAPPASCARLPNRMRCWPGSGDEVSRASRGMSGVGNLEADDGQGFDRVPVIPRRWVDDCQAHAPHHAGGVCAFVCAHSGKREDRVGVGRPLDRGHPSARGHGRRPTATIGSSVGLPGGQGVAGSNPVSPTDKGPCETGNHG